MENNPGYKFERKLVEVVDKIREGQDKTKKAMSKEAFRHLSKPDNKWQAVLRGNTKQPKPSRLTIEDIYHISKSLGYRVDHLMAAVLSEFEKNHKK